MEYAPSDGATSGSFVPEAPTPTDGGCDDDDGAHIVPPGAHRHHQHHLHGHQLTISCCLTWR